MPQLSCESCALRKVRCDKEYPCSTCTKMGLTCVPVQRMRLPRGRRVHTLKAENRELRDKLEQLNETLDNRGIEQSADECLVYPPVVPTGDQSYDQSSIPDHIHPSMSGGPLPSQPSLTTNEPPQNFIARDFWNKISQEDPGLNDLLDQPAPPLVSDTTSTSSSERQQSSSQHSSSTGITGGSNFMLGLGQGTLRDPGVYLEAAMVSRPDPDTLARLWNVYITRVDPIVRLFHQPTLQEYLLHGKPYLKYDDNDPTLNLVRSSIFFISVATLQDSQCRALFGIEKQAALESYRNACELALEQVELIVTEDITVLQSFMLYLLAIRTYDRSRKTWTLFSLVVRLATAIGINEDDYRSYEPFFDQQMRRRLWYSMCSMDAHLAFDRASKPLIAPNSRHPRLPNNINEASFGPLSEEVPEEEGITDMSLALMLYHTQATGKGLNFAAMMPNSTNPEQQAKRREIWSNYESYMTKLLAQVDPNLSTSNWCLYHNGFTAFAALQLAFQRPTKAGHRQKQAMDTETTNILRMAVTVLEHDLLKRWDIRGESFNWHGNTLWTPLAVAISECYTCNDVLLLQQVWPIIETHFNCLSTILAEYRQGILWQPLERLIAKTRVRVRNVINQQAAMNGGMLAANIYYPLQPFFPEATLTEDMVMPSSNYPTLSMSTDGLLPFGTIASPYILTSAPWSPLQTTPTPVMSSQPYLGQASAPSSSSQPAYQMDSNRMDPGWETWDNFLCSINFDMYVQGP